MRVKAGLPNLKKRAGVTSKPGDLHAVLVDKPDVREGGSDLFSILELVRIAKIHRRTGVERGQTGEGT